MSYTTLNTLDIDFAAAVTATAGLSSYLFDEVSAINKNHNTSYPLCVVSPPNFSVENINKGWAKYQMEVHIIQVSNKSIADSIEYDDAMELFSEWVSNLMKQRDGEYVLSQDLSVGTVRNLGSDNTIGIRVEFSMLVPSIIIESNP
jgi:archaellin